MFHRETRLFCFAHHMTLWINYPAKKKSFYNKKFLFFPIKNNRLGRTRYGLTDKKDRWASAYTKKKTKMVEIYFL